MNTTRRSFLRAIAGVAVSPLLGQIKPAGHIYSAKDNWPLRDTPCRLIESRGKDYAGICWVPYVPLLEYDMTKVRTSLDQRIIDSLG